jgi:hypothetical protein
LNTTGRVVFAMKQMFGRNRVVRILIGSVCIFFVFLNPLEGQNTEVAELVTDRPDFTESGIVVPIGSFQFEGGLTWESSAGDVRSFSGPEFLLRWGLTSRMEVRIGLPDYVGVWNGQNQSGLADPSIGTKLQLGPIADGWDLATVVTVSAPAGEAGFSSDGWDPSVFLSTGGGIGGTWSLGSQVFGELATNGGDRELFWGGTLVLATSIGSQGITGSFFELAATIPEEGTTAVSFHHGYTHLLTKTLQLDVHGGFGLTETAPDFFIGAGMVYRR